MHLIVGLGNPGEQYTRNRHNVGFQAVKVLADRHALRFEEKAHQSRLATGRIMQQRVVLAKPFTFMNDSGRAVAALVRWHKLDPATHLLVIMDDLDLPFGTLRLRASGSAGGQNGMKSIIAQLGTPQFSRLRIGIGRPAPGRDPAAYVLQNWDKDQAPSLPDLLSRAADASEVFIADGIAAAMNRFNIDKPARPHKPAEARTTNDEVVNDQ